MVKKDKASEHIKPDLDIILQEMTQLHEQEKNRLRAEIVRLKQKSYSGYTPEAVFIVEKVINPLLATVARFLEELSGNLPEQVRKEVLEILDKNYFSQIEKKI